MAALPYKVCNCPMIFLTSSFGAGSRFLAQLAVLIDSEELSRFSLEGGFTDPNNFPFQNVARVLGGHAFPTTDLFEYGWAIRECGIDRLKCYSPQMRLFAASIYLYCYRVSEFDGNFQGEFLYLLVKSEVDAHGPACASLLLSFLEWMVEHVPSHAAYSDYDLLLAWTFVALHLGMTTEPAFALVLSKLRELNYSAVDLALNNDSVFPQPDDWFALLVKIQVGEAELDAMLPIICGFNE